MEVSTRRCNIDLTWHCLCRKRQSHNETLFLKHSMVQYQMVRGRPCGSTARAKNRWTKAELYDILDRNAITYSTTMDLTQLCNLIPVKDGENIGEHQERQKNERQARQKSERRARQKNERLERQKSERLELQKNERQARQKNERLERQKNERLELQKSERLERQKNERLERQKNERLELQKSERLERQKNERLERQKNERLERQKNERPERQKSERQKVRKYKHISGITRYAQYLYDDKIIHLMGEQHDSSGCDECDHGLKDCITSLDLIENIIGDSKMTDIYVENPYVYGDDLGELHADNRSGLVDFNEKYHDCLRVDKSSCNIPNARFHYADIRLSYDFRKLTDLIDRMTSYYIRSLQNGRMLRSHAIWQLRENFTSLLNIIDIIVNKKDVMSAIEKNRDVSPSMKSIVVSWKQRGSLVTKSGESRILKQLIGVPPFLSHKILKNANSVITGMKSYLVTISGEDLIRYHTNIMLVITSVVMDTYLLARMFRRFHGPHQESDQVIVLAGYGHIQRYQEFFEEYMPYRKPGILGWNDDSILKMFSYRSTVDQNCVTFDKARVLP